VTFEGALLEAVLEELGEEVLVFAEGDHAVADVAGREHFEVFAETAGGASVVGDGDDGGEIADEAGVGWCGVLTFGLGRGSVGGATGCGGRGDVAFESTEKRREAGASADGDDAEGGLRGLAGRGGMGLRMQGRIQG
jgi:hypothetical protein